MTAASSSPRTGRERICLVDDDVRAIAALRDTLLDEGFDVAAFTDPTVALAEFRNGHSADILLSDLMMPAMSGIDLVRGVAETDSNIVGIIMTGHATVETAVEALKAGAYDYVLKPLKLSNLRPVLARALELRRLRQEKEQALDELHALNEDLERRVAHRTTELRRVNEALAESEARFRELAENVDHVFWVMELSEPKVLYVSSAYERIWERPCQSLLVAPTSWMDPVVSDDIALVRESFARLRSGGTFDCEYRIQNRNGVIRWIRDRGFPILGPTGRVVRAVGIAEDISKERQAAAALKAAEEQLRHAQKMEAVGRLAGGVAHDFNNLLTGIIGYTQFLLKSNLRGQERTDLERIRELTDRASNLTRQLLTFSRRHPIRAVAFRLGELLANVGKLLGSMLGENIRIHYELNARHDQVCADQGQIEQVVFNLAINARDAMPKGGKLTIGTRDCTTAASKRLGLTGDQYVVFSIADEGCGMDRATLERIFEPFFTTKEAGKGTGLGLATAYGIIKQHHGHIEVLSTPGGGTVFDVYLPCARSEQPSSTSGGEAQPEPRGSATVLLVEDEEQVREIARRGLEELGYRVLTAGSSEEAETILAKDGANVQVLLTDVVLPGRSGKELYDYLCERYPGIKIIFMSGYTEESMSEHGVADLGLPYIQKPFNASQLGNLIREVIG